MTSTFQALEAISYVSAKKDLEIAELRTANDVMRGLLLWALYNHQGGSSDIGQPIRKALGIGSHDNLTPQKILAAETAVDAVMARIEILKE